MPIQIASRNQRLAAAIRKFLAESGLTDLHPGSVLLTLLEAGADGDASVASQLVEILNASSLDSLSGTDLENRAVELGLTGRNQAAPATGAVTITDKRFAKVSTRIYAGAPGPLAGESVIKVESVAGLANGNKIYVGRNGSNGEGPFTIQAVAAGATYGTITLTTPLAKDHLAGESVVKGTTYGARKLAAGTTVRVPASSLNPAVEFRFLSSAALLDGETTVEDVPVECTQSGEQGNAAAGRVCEFKDSTTNSNYSVTNPYTFTSGLNLETDSELRNRIRDHIQSLSKGTMQSIITGLVGLQDSDEGKRVASVAVQDASETEPARVYIDDGSGFEPGFDGVAEETVIDAAVGGEKYLQLGETPLTRPQVETSLTQPYNLSGGETLILGVGGRTLTKTFSATDFATPGAAKAREIADAINNDPDVGPYWHARTSDSGKRVVLTPAVSSVAALTIHGGTANTFLAFPEGETAQLYLYKNDRLLSNEGLEAKLFSQPVSKWAIIQAGDYCKIAVDGTAYQSYTFADADFAPLNTTVEGATPTQIVEVLNTKIAGATFALQGDVLAVYSNKGKSSSAKVAVKPDGTLPLTAPSGTDFWHAIGIENYDGLDEFAVSGSDRDYIVNRLNGQIELVEALDEGDKVSAGTDYTPAFSESQTLGATINLANEGAKSYLVVVVDDPALVTRSLLNKAFAFAYDSSHFDGKVQAGDFLACGNGYNGAFGWTYDHASSGKIYSVSAVTGATLTVNAYAGGSDYGPGQFRAFKTSAAPQVVAISPGVYTPAQLVALLNAGLGGAVAELIDNRIRISTLNRSSTGAICVYGLGALFSQVKFDETLRLNTKTHRAGIQSHSDIGTATDLGDSTKPLGEVASGSATSVVEAGSRTYSKATAPGKILYFPLEARKLLGQTVKDVTNSSKELVLVNSAPTHTGPIDTNAAFSLHMPFDFGHDDRLVVEFDGDTQNKTISVPMFRRGKITAINANSFSATDEDVSPAASFAAGSNWATGDFDGYKALFPYRCAVKPTADVNKWFTLETKTSEVRTLAQVALEYPTKPNQSTKIESRLANRTTPTVILGSGPAKYTPPANSVWFAQVVNTNMLRFALQYTLTFISTSTVGLSVGDTIRNGAGLWAKVAEAKTLTASLLSIKVHSLSADSAFAVGDQLSVSSDGIIFTPISDAGAGAGVTDFRLTNSVSGADPSVASVGDICTFTTDGTLPLPANASGVTLSTGFIWDVNHDRFTVKLTGANTYPTLPGNYTPHATAWSIYGLADNTAEQIVQRINDEGTYTASLYTGGDGSGTVIYSTADYDSNLTTTDWYGGERYVYAFDTAQTYPFSTLGLNLHPDIDSVGMSFRLVPQSAKNVVSHLSKKCISALPLVAETSMTGDRSVVVSTLVNGSAGKVKVTGGSANVLSAYAKDNGVDGGTYVKLSFNVSDNAAFHVDQYVVAANRSAVKKNAHPTLSQSALAATTTVDVAVNTPSVGYTKFTFKSVNATSPLRRKIRTIDFDNGAAVYKLPDVARIRFVDVNDVDITADDWLIVDGAAPAKVVSVLQSGNEAKMVDIPLDAYSGAYSHSYGDTVYSLASDFKAYDYHSIVPGDILSISKADNMFADGNVGEWKIVSVSDPAGNPATVEVVVTAASSHTNQSNVALTNNVDKLSFFEGAPYSGIRRVLATAQDSSGRYVSLVQNDNKPTLVKDECKVSALNLLDFPTLPAEAVDAYNYHTGLLRLAQWKVTGYDRLPTEYPGIAAAGVQVEVMPPRVFHARLSLRVSLLPGRTFNGTLINSIKAAVAAYVNALRVGEPVILSRVVETVHRSVAGVKSVLVDSTQADRRGEKISVASAEKALITNDDISVNELG